MEKSDSAGIAPVKLNANSEFKFRCHKDVACFTKCCRGIDIPLTPYDIVSLKNRLGLSSSEFLAMYTTPRLLEKTDLPMVTMRMLDDDPSGEPSCPFVRPDGCIVYEDRPSACRYYPLGVASLSYKPEVEEGFYIMIKEPHCLGFDEDTQWTVARWRKDQGIDIHDEINAPWIELIVRKRSFPANIRLTEKTKNMFFTASYDIDRFRRFVFESSFLKLYDIDDKTVAAIREDEINLLRFSFDWLKWLLFKEGGFTLNPEEAKKRKPAGTPASALEDNL